jgi:hypothetical protein
MPQPLRHTKQSLPERATNAKKNVTGVPLAENSTTTVNSQGDIGRVTLGEFWDALAPCHSWNGMEWAAAVHDFMWNRHEASTRMFARLLQLQ